MQHREAGQSLSERAFYMQIMLRVKIKQKLRNLCNISSKLHIFVVPKRYCQSKNVTFSNDRSTFIKM